MKCNKAKAYKDYLDKCKEYGEWSQEARKAWDEYQGVPELTAYNEK